MERFVVHLPVNSALQDYLLWYSSSAQGYRGTTPSVAKLKPGSQTPEKSTFPSNSKVRGVGQTGASSSVMLPPAWDKSAKGNSISIKGVCQQSKYCDHKHPYH